MKQPTGRESLAKHVALAAGVWGASSLVYGLVEALANTGAGLYQPIWEYGANTLAWDLAAHLGYGATTGAAFWLLVRERATGR